MNQVTARSLTLAAVAAAAWMTNAQPVLAGSAPRADFSMRFAAMRPGTASSLRLYILYKGSTPSAKPSPIRKIVIAFPRGTRFDTSALPRCTASDQQLLAQSDAACPARSRLGAGTLSAVTGFGAPIDPFLTTVSIYNAAGQIIELVKDPTTGRPLATDRFRINGSTWIGTPPAIPGGPPDGQTAVRKVDFTYNPPARWAITPPRCPRARRWVSTGRFTYADATTATVNDHTRCKPRPKVPRKPRHHRRHHDLDRNRDPARQRPDR